MSEDRKTALFSVFAFGLIAFCFVILLQQIVLSQKLWHEIPRVFAGLLAPVPIALFLGFVFANCSGDSPADPNPKLMTAVLLLTILAVIGIGMLSGSAGREVGMGPVMTQAAVFSSSLINMSFAKNPTLAALLSGISIGLTVFVIFLT